MRQPTLVNVAQWILATWKDLDPAVIHNGFLKCCISNALDGSDDDPVLQDQQSASDAEEDDGDVYYDGMLNDVNLATIESLLDSDSDDENTFEGFR